MNYLQYVKPAVDFIVQSMNYFPGLKTKVGAIFTVLGTLMLLYNTYGSALFGFHFPDEIPLSLLGAGQVLTAVGAANQSANNKPPAA